MEISQIPHLLVRESTLIYKSHFNKFKRMAFPLNGNESLYLSEIQILVFPINDLFTIFLNFIVSEGNRKLTL